MRKTPATTIAGAITLVALGALTTFALRPVAKPAPAALPVEVRTQVVRRTVWIVKHEKPTQPHRSRTPAAGAPPHPGTTAGSTTAAATTGTAAIASAPRTTASRARTTAIAAPAATGVSTARPSTSAGSSVAPVTTHSSRSTAATSTGTAGTPVARKPRPQPRRPPSR